MDERDQVLIERYLAGDLTPEERRQAEDRLANDPEFRQLWSSNSHAVDSLREYDRAKWRERFRQRDAILDQAHQTRTLKPVNRIWWWSAAALLAGLVIWRVMLTLNANPIPGIKSEEELYAAYFSPFKSDMTEPVEKGEHERTQLDQFNAFYWKGNYAGAVSLYDSLPVELQSNDNVRFRYANALLAEQQTDKASLILENIVRNHQSHYTAESEWLLALCAIRQHEPGKAKDYLTHYIADVNALHKPEARRIIKWIDRH
ncbi:MAG TPA: tetratricopeptide repeat protein [Saprospiraceae bacterium]|nr:tetratricopeptide repeat protein [Saprospiraceae bacterium]